ncbi:MAG TPA: OsmC family peroxiredoxin [Actinomycetota bacterium]|nr:OsmC family peroxiredoxin [Actinomycetota bacterium]
MSAQRRGEATWSGSLMEGSGSVALASSGAADELPVTWASRSETPGGKTSPEELIAAAHAGCYAMALSNELAGQGNAPERLQVTAVSSFDKVGDDFRVTRMDLEVNGSVPGIDDPAFEKAAQAAKDACPVSNALKNNVEITLKASLA